MAQRTLVLLEDDNDGGEAVETVQFGLDGTAYEITLNRANIDQSARHTVTGPPVCTRTWALLRCAGLSLRPPPKTRPEAELVTGLI